MSAKFVIPLKKSLCVAVVLAVTLNSTAVAQDTQASVEPAFTVTKANFVEDAGGSQRINLSGKLRMLSQRIPAAACNVNAGIAMDKSEALLDGAVAEFLRIISALEFGDDELGVYGAEERHRTLRVIQEVHTKLEPILAALDGAPTNEDVVTLANANMELLDMAKLLVSELSGEYSNPVALRQSDVMAIDIAGRQRMLTQKMSKEICLALSDVNASSSLETLSGTMKMFEVSHDALRHGMETVGLTPAPNDEIAAGLLQVEAHWTGIRGLVDTVATGGQVTEAERTQIFVGLNTTMAEMNRVVGLYSAASKLGL